MKNARNIYPGESRCQNTIPHAKWHSESAVAFLDFVYIADQINEVTKGRGSFWNWLWG